MLISDAGYGSSPDRRAKRGFGAASWEVVALPLLRRQKTSAIVNIASLGGRPCFAGGMTQARRRDTGAVHR